MPSVCGSPDSNRLLLVEGDPEAGRRLSEKLRAKRWRVVWAASALEAKQILNDAQFLELGLDALLISYNLPDSTGAGVIQDFCAEWPSAAVALMIASDNIAVNVWASQRKIRLMHTPLRPDELDNWLQGVKVKVDVKADVKASA